jgi:hypothetical protein
MQWRRRTGRLKQMIGGKSEGRHKREAKMGCAEKREIRGHVQKAKWRRADGGERG